MNIMTDHVELTVYGWATRLILAFVIGCLATYLWLRRPRKKPNLPVLPAEPEPFRQVEADVKPTIRVVEKLTIDATETVNELARRCRQPETDR